MNSGGHHSFHHWLQNSVWVVTIAEISNSVINFLKVNVYSTYNTNMSVSISVEGIISL